MSDIRAATRSSQSALGVPMRYEKADTILRLALDMQGTPEGLSLEDIRKNYSDRPLSRRTAERLRDAVERVFPQFEQANPGERPKRWRLPAGTTGGLATITVEELADLTTAVSILRRENFTQDVKLKKIAQQLRKDVARFKKNNWIKAKRSVVDEWCVRVRRLRNNPDLIALRLRPYQRVPDPLGGAIPCRSPL